MCLCVLLCQPCRPDDPLLWATGTLHNAAAASISHAQGAAQASHKQRPHSGERSCVYVCMCTCVCVCLCVCTCVCVFSLFCVRAKVLCFLSVICKGKGQDVWGSGGR